MTMHLSVIILSILLCSGVWANATETEVEEDTVVVSPEPILDTIEPTEIKENMPEIDDKDDAEKKESAETDEILKPVLPLRGCKDLAGKCCQGRNSSCYVSNRYKDGKKWRNCYCDSECTLTGDCCHDYQETCPATDCELSEWTPWGPCSKLCGHGHYNRTRQITTAAQNGGQRCAHLVETGKCLGNNCNTKRETRKKAKKETGRILPIRFATYRTSSKYDIRKGIRKNLFYHYHSENSILTKPTYCATYVITYARPHCRRQRYGDWAKDLTRGARMCVECQSNAMHPSLNGRCKGDGVLKSDTRWKAVGVNACSGWWKMVTKQKACECNARLKSSYIFV